MAKFEKIDSKQMPQVIGLALGAPTRPRWQISTGISWWLARLA